MHTDAEMGITCWMCTENCMLINKEGLLGQTERLWQQFHAWGLCYHPELKMGEWYIISTIRWVIAQGWKGGRYWWTESWNIPTAAQTLQKGLCLLKSIIILVFRGSEWKQIAWKDKRHFIWGLWTLEDIDCGQVIKTLHMLQFSVPCAPITPG